jgi:hypothetical protein
MSTTKTKELKSSAHSLRGLWIGLILIAIIAELLFLQSLNKDKEASMIIAKSYASYVKTEDKSHLLLIIKEHNSGNSFATSILSLAESK